MKSTLSKLRPNDRTHVVKIAMRSDAFDGMRSVNMTRASFKRGVTSLLLAFNMSFWAWSCLRAQTNAVPLSRYSHTAWRTEEGLLIGAPSGITQTLDGYLWIGTSSRLFRFDGVKFTDWPVDHKMAKSLEIFDVKGARDGSLWVGTSAGLLHMKDNRWIAVLDTKHLGGRINKILEAPNGTIWVARTRVPKGWGGTCKVSGDHLQCLTVDDTTRCSTGETIAQDEAGRLWVGAYPALCQVDLNKELAYLPNLSPQDHVVPLAAILPRHELPLLAGFAFSGPTLGLETFEAGQFKSYDVGGLIGSQLRVTSLVMDIQQGLWIGTANDGIYHVEGGKADHFGRADGLSGDGVQNIFQDREGDVWVATYNGLDRFRALTVTSLSSHDGLLADQTNAVVNGVDGKVFVSEVGGVQVIQDGAIKTYGPSARLAEALFVDHEGKLWAGLDEKLGTFEEGRFVSHDTLNGQDPGFIRSIIEDRDHTIWLISNGSKEIRLYRSIGTRIERVEVDFPLSNYLAADPRSGVWLRSKDSFVHYDHGQFLTVEGPPANLHVDRFLVTEQGSIWAWGPGGLSLSSGGRWLTIDGQHGLPCDAVDSVLDDSRGSLWLNLECGLVVLSKAELSRVLLHSQNDALVKPTYIFDASDGAQSGISIYDPAATVDSTGRLWFSDEGLLRSVDPNHLAINKVLPPVHIEQLTADHTTYSAQAQVQLPPLTRDIIIDYTALSLVNPAKVKFKYRLSGVDRTWQEIGSRRQAFYMNLKPGSYRFQVIACNNSGYWNTEGDSLTFVIPPKFYQTTWFMSAMCVCALLLIIFIFKIRLRLAMQVAESRLAERNRIARELHDTLLQGLQALLLRLHVTMEAIPVEEPARNLLAVATNHAETALLAGRTKVRELRAHQSSGLYLIEELETMVEELREVGSPSIRLIVTGKPRSLKSLVADELYSFVREAVTNAVRHSQGSEVLAEVQYTRMRLTVSVIDNGIGISSEMLSGPGKPGHWGLTGLRERSRNLGATMKIQSDQAGTRIILNVPGRRAFAQETSSKFQ